MTFLDFVLSLDLIPRDISPRGTWTRCGTNTHPRKRNGSYLLASNGRFGLAQNWETMTECAVWRTDHGQNTREQHARDNADLTERLRLRAEAERAGTQAARERYSAAEPLINAKHPYCERKRIGMHGLKGVRVDTIGNLLVPMYRMGRFVSVQRIAPDGSKLFASGAPVKGAYFPMLRPKAPASILCEGLATGATLFEALPSATVIVCFSAANLSAVAERLDWPMLTAVASDNDHKTAARIGKNPGIDAAKNAANIIGCGSAIPTCDGSDWNDFFTEHLAALEETSRHAPPWNRSPEKLRRSALALIADAVARCYR